jgi:hypothetical protein
VSIRLRDVASNEAARQLGAASWFREAARYGSEQLLKIVHDQASYVVRW